MDIHIHGNLGDYIGSLCFWVTAMGVTWVAEVATFHFIRFFFSLYFPTFLFSRF